jgi:phosphoribosylformylglycinamidine synthase
VPVADCAVTLADYKGFAGEAMSMGERTPLAAIDAPASGRMAVAEAITNLLAAPIELPRSSCRPTGWPPAASRRRRRAVRTVKAVGMELCPALGISIPVGKDSLSMRTQWTRPARPEGHLARQPDRHRLCRHRRCAQHPDPAARRRGGRQHPGADRPGPGKNRMGGSMLAQVLNQSGNEVPDWTTPRT